MRQLINVVSLLLLFTLQVNSTHAAQPEVSGPVKASMSIIPPRTILKTQRFDLRMGLINDTAATKSFSARLNTITSVNIAVAKDIYDKYGYHQSF